MAYNFPDSPTVGQVFQKWTWNGEAWVLTAPVNSAGNTTFAPAGNIAATNVQAAIVELDNEKVAKAGDTMTGNLSLNFAGPIITINKTGNSQQNSIYGQRQNNMRWNMRLGNDISEGGSNTGSNFDLHRYADDGAYLGAVFTIERNSGNATFNNNIYGKNGAQVSGDAANMPGIFYDGANVGVRAANGQGVYMQTANGTTYGIFNSAGLSVTGSISATSNLSISGAATITGLLTANNGLTVNVGRPNFNSGYAVACAAGEVYQAGSSNVEVIGAGGGNGAYMSFHRPGAYALNFGLGSNNRLMEGGWSVGGGNWYQIWTSRDFSGPVTNIRLLSAGDWQFQYSSPFVGEPWAGAVMVGAGMNYNGTYVTNVTGRFRWLQLFANGGWATVGTA